MAQRSSFFGLAFLALVAGCYNAKSDDIYDVPASLSLPPGGTGSGPGAGPGGSGGAGGGAGGAGGAAQGGAGQGGGGVGGAGGAANVPPPGGCECLVEGALQPNGGCNPCLFNLNQAGFCAAVAAECSADPNCSLIVESLPSCPAGQLELCWSQIATGPSALPAASITLASTFLDCSCTECTTATSCVGSSQCPF
jgi:hypothetical protein